MLTSQIASSGRYRLGDLELDVDQRRLMRQGRDLKLSKLTFRTLRVLASAAPGLVTNNELASRVWDGRIVSPETVMQRVKLLRKALQDDARAPRYLEVVRGQGIRWIADIEPLSRTHTQSTGFQGNPDASRDVDLTLPSKPSICILPFDTMGDNKVDHNIFADGLTHDITTSIGRVRWLFVVARGSSFKFRGGRFDVQEVAQKLGVRYVVQGNISFVGLKISLNVALADAVQGGEIWAEHIYADVSDFFKIQEEIAGLIVGSVESEIEHAEQKRSLLEPPANLDAWSAYHRGWWHLNSFAADCFDQAENYFNLSQQLDPTSARTQAGLSCVHWLRAFLELTDDRDGEIERCLELAQQSIELDARDPLGHWALGRAFHLCRNFDRAVHEFAIAIDLNPNFALGIFAQAFAMMHIGDNERSNSLLENAHRLSPYDTMSYAMLGVKAINNAMLGRYDKAADLSVRGAKLLTFYCQMYPVFAAVCNVMAGRDDIAGQYFSDLRDARPAYSSSDYFRAFPHQREKDVAKITHAFETLEQIH
jgi:TolB-like protein